MIPRRLPAAAKGLRGLSLGGYGLAFVAAALLVHLLARCSGPRSNAPEPSAPPAADRAPAVELERENVPVAPRSAPVPFTLPAEPPVRVALATVRGATRLRLSTDGPCEVSVGDAPPVKRTRLDRYEVASGPSGFRAPGIRPGATSLRFRAEGGLEIDGKPYRGDLILTIIDGGRIDAVNALSMEEYLRGVVPGEMPRTFPSAALDAQAIVARTYALATVSGLRSGSPLVLTDDVSDQVYGGRGAETKETDAAVRRTAGLVVSFDGSPIVAYFHSTCGGHTSDPGPVLSRPTSPALRGVPCGACDDSPHARWTAEIPRDDVRKALLACGVEPAAAAAFSLAPGSRDDGGRRLEFRATSGRDGSASGIDANAFRLAIGPRRLKSTRVESIETKGGSILFAGGGFGHGCGLCQYGARGLAARGLDARSILGHYFPGAAVARAYPAAGGDATALR